MKIVIDIPEGIYSYVNTQWKDIPKNDSPISILCNAVIDGTPLPKGHGRIGDLDRLYYVFKKNVVSADAFKELFDHAPTIIEADKEASDG